MDIHLKCSENEEIKYSPNQAIAAGANHDICSLIHKVTALFDEYRRPRFRHFIDIWKDMKFGLIFCGRQTFREMFEFTEDLFDLVKLQAITLTKFGNRAAAVYLLYALYFKQPARPLVRIKMTMAEYANLSQFIDKCRQDKHWDLAYVWVKLMTDNAFHFVAAERPYGIDTINSIELRRNAGLLCGTNSKFKSTENPFKTEEFQLKMKKLEKIHAAYTRMKIGLRENPTVPDTRLSMISDNLPAELLEILEPSSQLRNANEDESTMTRGNLLQDNEGITIGHRRKQLRDKAFKLEGTSHKEQNIFRNEDDGLHLEMHENDPSSDLSKTKKAKIVHRTREAHTSRFFDADTSTESLTDKKLKLIKEKKAKKEKKRKNREDYRTERETNERAKRAKRNKARVDLDFKKKERLINEKRKADRLAAIEETLIDVLQCESDKDIPEVSKSSKNVIQSTGQGE